MDGRLACAGAGRVVGEALGLDRAAAAVDAALEAGARSEHTRHVVAREIGYFVEWWSGAHEGAAPAPVEGDLVRYMYERRGAEMGRLSDHVGSTTQKTARRALFLLLQAIELGTVDLGMPLREPVEPCPVRWRGVLDGYASACAESGNADDTVLAKRTRAAAFLGWCDCRVRELSDIGPMEVAGYFLSLSGKRRKTVATVATDLRDLPRHLESRRLVGPGLAGAVPRTRVIRNESVPYLWSAAEVNAILTAIDRSSAIGKRDYALLLLVARLGLRGSDVRKLRASSIDWSRKELRITQSKTGLPLTLPLPDDVGWAIIDYLRDGRPDTECDLVFVRHRWPFRELRVSSSLWSRLRMYARKAKIEFPEGQMHGMHSFRSALARRMLENDTPLPVISQVLGHASSDTTVKYYLRLDLEGMRECAADVEDVLANGGGGDE